MDAARAQADRAGRALEAGAADRVEAGVARIDALDAALAQLDARLALAKAGGRLEDAVQVPLGVDPEIEPSRTAQLAGGAGAETKR